MRTGALRRIKALMRSHAGKLAVGLAAVLVVSGAWWLWGRTSDEAQHAEPGRRQWRYIVLHHSATVSGNAEQFDTYHREKNGWDSLGYHFVIDNGRGGPDGRVEVGPRWVSQSHGAHTGGTRRDEYNQHGIGICLVGNFMEHDPTPAQLASAEKLVRELMTTHGIPAENVIGHRQAPGADTACPGDRFMQYIDATLRPMLAGE